jgi:hypothetical protein
MILKRAQQYKEAAPFLKSFRSMFQPKPMVTMPNLSGSLRNIKGVGPGEAGQMFPKLKSMIPNSRPVSGSPVPAGAQRPTTPLTQTYQKQLETINANKIGPSGVKTTQIEPGVFEFSGPRAKEVMARTAMNQALPRTMTKAMVKLFPYIQQFGKSRFSNYLPESIKRFVQNPELQSMNGLTIKKLQDLALPYVKNMNLVGTINRGNNYLNADLVNNPLLLKQMGMTKPGVIAHEKFHSRVPFFGTSEVLAHGYGGLMSTPGKLNFPAAWQQMTEHLPRTRPGRASMELAVPGTLAAGGAGYGIGNVINDNMSNDSYEPIPNLGFGLGGMLYNKLVGNQ